MKLNISFDFFFILSISFSILPKVWMAPINQIKKRQIFREHVLPTLGGKIPSSAFHPTRLQYNTNDAAGIEAIDAVAYQLRELDIRPGLRDPEDTNELLTITNYPYPTEPTDYSGKQGPTTHRTSYLIRKPAGRGIPGPIIASDQLRSLPSYSDYETNASYNFLRSLLITDAFKKTFSYF